MKQYTFDNKAFSKAVKLKRTIELNLDLRQVQDIVGLSSATLSRVERGFLPDLLTYAKICKWLKMPMDYYIKIQK